MAFPTYNAQQEINNRKILDDLNVKKQLLQKGLMQVNPPSGPGTPPSVQPQTEAHSNLAVNNLARAAWTQANNQSFGFFVPSDSAFGNNILPVLPRYDQPPPSK